MEYQKIANLLNDESNKPSKFRTRNRGETNDDIRGAYSPNKQIRFKTAMLRSSLCDYIDAYILVKGNISVNNTAAKGASANNATKKVIFKDWAPFTNCISKTNNTQMDNTEYIDIIMPKYNLSLIKFINLKLITIGYSDNYSKISRSLWQYCKEISAVNNPGNIIDFTVDDTTDLFKFKTKMTGQTNNDGQINGVEIIVLLKCLSNFWRTLEMSLINCEVEFILNWSTDCVIISTNVANRNPTFTITVRNLYAPVVTLSTQDNAKLLPN